ncbi:MAG: hypothetical protein V4538_16330 [Bacteroidota bacterium]
MAFNFKKVKINFERLKINLPKQIANEGQKFYFKNFDSESWEGKRWAPRIARRGIKKRDITRKLLVNKAMLRRAVANMKREATFSRIRFEVFVQSKTGFNYAQVHNEGIGKQRRRKFLGYNKTLDGILRNKINSELSKCFK